MTTWGCKHPPVKAVCFISNLMRLMTEPALNRPDWTLYDSLWFCWFWWFSWDVGLTVQWLHANRSQTIRARGKRLTYWLFHRASLCLTLLQSAFRKQHVDLRNFKIFLLYSLKVFFGAGIIIIWANNPNTINSLKEQTRAVGKS